NFTDLFVHQVAPVLLAGDDGFAGFLYAAGAERIGLARKAQRRLGLFPGLEQRLIRPLRAHGRIGIVLLEILDGVERDVCGLAHEPVKRPCDLRANGVRHKPLSSLSELRALYKVPHRETGRAGSKERKVFDAKAAYLSSGFVAPNP